MGGGGERESLSSSEDYPELSPGIRHEGGGGGGMGGEGEGGYCPVDEKILHKKCYLGRMVMIK
jgi:hypothetical protein